TPSPAPAGRLVAAVFPGLSRSGAVDDRWVRPGRELPAPAASCGWRTPGKDGSHRDRRPASVPRAARRVPTGCTASAVPAGTVAGRRVARAVPAAPEDRLVAGPVVRNDVDHPAVGAAARSAAVPVVCCRREARAPAGGARPAPPVRGARWVVDPQVSFVGGPSADSSVLSTGRAAQTKRAARPGECDYSRAFRVRSLR